MAGAAKDAMPTWVVALGGNAMLRSGQEGTYGQQFANVTATARALARVIRSGQARLVIAHGNGPQVGSILLQNEIAADTVPAMPLDVCGAQSQGFLGYLLAQAISSELNGENRSVANVLTRVEVDADDPAFVSPTKPIGRYYSEVEARQLEAQGMMMRFDAARGGWRRLVPSPQPRRILELRAIKTLLDSGTVVIAGGGGGVPVVRDGDRYRGVEAVIDKDLASALLADQLGADALFILTDVPAVAVNFGTPQQHFLGHVSASELRKWQSDGHFASGSMGPKVEAVLRFVEAGEQRIGSIGSLEQFEALLAGEAGTRVASDP